MVKKILLLILFISFSFISFSQEKSIKDVIASPNPFTNKTTFYFKSNSSEQIILTVKNVLGKTVFHKAYKVHAGKNELPFYRNNLKSGMYIYAIQTKEQVISKRFVIR